MPIHRTRSAERDFNRHHTTNYILTACSPDKKTTNNQRPKTSHAETNNNTQTSQTHSVAHIHHIFVPPQFKVPKQRPTNKQQQSVQQRKNNHANKSNHLSRTRFQSTSHNKLYTYALLPRQENNQQPTPENKPCRDKQQHANITNAFRRTHSSHIRPTTVQSTKTTTNEQTTTISTKTQKQSCQ